jgi:hypothetical protein
MGQDPAAHELPFMWGVVVARGPKVSRIEGRSGGQASSCVQPFLAEHRRCYLTSFAL